jgi:hypothetical protein
MRVLPRTPGTSDLNVTDGVDCTPVLSVAVDGVTSQSGELVVGELVKWVGKLVPDREHSKVEFPGLVVSKILNHVETGVTAAYDRHSYDQDERAALDFWGKRVEAIIANKRDAKVLSFRPRI